MTIVTNIISFYIISSTFQALHVYNINYYKVFLIYITSMRLGVHCHIFSCLGYMYGKMLRWPDILNKTKFHISQVTMVVEMATATYYNTDFSRGTRFPTI